MELIYPGLGIIVWTAVVFLIVVFVLGRFAWGPILAALREREDSIQNALESADKAREEMGNLKAENDKLLQEARAERDQILKSAKETADKMINEAKDQASVEADKIVQSAQQSIQLEKQAAIAELKTQVANISLDISERILRQELSDKDAQLALINRALEDSELN